MASSTNAAYQLLLISLDRVVSIKAPVLYDTRLKLGKLHFQIRNISIGLSIVAYTVTAASVLHVSRNDQTAKCEVLTETVIQLGSLLLVTILLGQALPFLILLFSNFTFSFALLSRRNRRNRNTNNPTLASSQQAAIEKGYIKMLFLLTSSFLLFNVASAALVLMASNRSEAVVRVGDALSLLFGVLDHACNFFFYYISGPMFREAFCQAPASESNELSTTNDAVTPARVLKAEATATEVSTHQEPSIH